MADEPATTGEERDPLGTLIGVLYAVALGINIVILADFATDGAVSREAKLWWTRGTAPLRAAWQRHATFREQRPRVIFDAMTTVEESDQ